MHPVWPSGVALRSRRQAGGDVGRVEFLVVTMSRLGRARALLALAVIVLLVSGVAAAVARSGGSDTTRVATADQLQSLASAGDAVVSRHTVRLEMTIEGKQGNRTTTVRASGLVDYATNNATVRFELPNGMGAVSVVVFDN